MATRERPIDAGVARARRVRQDITAELRSARLSSGASQALVARQLGLSRSQLSRIERGLAPLDLDLLIRAFAVVGMELSVRAYPAGEPIRDGGQLALLERFRRACHPSIRWQTEVPMPDPGDLRAWDLVGTVAGTRFACDGESRVRDLQALDRRLRLKSRDSGFERIILVVADTRTNRAVVRTHAPWVAERFAVPGVEARRALLEGRPPDGDALILV